MTSGSDPLAFKLMPGFDFMRQFAQAVAGNSATPNLIEWVTPTANVQEIDKRIANLKAVQGWLEQNVRMLGATVQALEIQKMTLGVLQSMNLDQADIVKAFTAPGRATEPASPKSAAQAASGAAAARPAPPQAKPTPVASNTAPVSIQTDPLQWWETLTRQFQAITAHALREAAQTMPPIKPVAPAAPTPAAQPPRPSAAKPTSKSSAKRAAPKKSASPAARRGAA